MDKQYTYEQFIEDSRQLFEENRELPVPDKGQPVNEGETDLYTAVERVFFSPWTYPNPWYKRNKELCDLLVVFGNHVLIFEDKKEVTYQDYGPQDDKPPELAWDRWYRKAVKASAEKIYKAERWLKRYPNKIYLDEDCTKPLPLELPPVEAMNVHRIAVTNRVVP